MVNEGAAFTGNLSRLSQVRLNTKSFTIADYATILSLPKKGGQPFIPTSTGGGLFVDTPVFYSTSENGTYVNFGNKIHYHTGDTDAEGGLFYQQFVKNIGAFHITQYFAFVKALFVQAISGTGAAVNDISTGGSGRIDLISGTDANGYANIQSMGLPLSFAYDSAFLARVTLTSTVTNYLGRIGISCERVGDSNDPTTRSYGIEACPADTKVLVFSCDGSTRSTIPTVFDVDTALYSWLARHRPALPKIWVNRDGDFTAGNTAEKTNNIPSSSNSLSTQLMSMGMKGTAGSASRTGQFKGMVIAGMPFTGWQFFYPQYPET